MTTATKKTAAKKTRIRSSGPLIRTRAQAEEVLGRVAADTAAKNEALSLMEQQITEIRQSYEAELSEIEASIEANVEQLRAFAESEVGAAEFGRHKSIEMLHGTIGHRTSPPAVKTLRGQTFKKVVDEVDAEFIRTKRELDRDAILSAYAQGNLDDQDLKAWRLKVQQSETFFVEPKLEEPAGTVAVKG